ncbi:disulfide bond formation protein B [Patescibacteria group bacterium]|nr:disulfide bond formation protein B [Patescibacteria group bacterium]
MNAYLYQYIIATAVLIIQAVLLTFIIMMLTKQDRKLRAHMRKHGMVYGMILAIAAIIGSLGFSEGYNFEPCELCWIQRIFHYPQLVIFAVGMYYRDMRAWSYSLWLAILGLIVGVYQVLIQFSPTLAESSICNLNPSTADCSEVLIQAYGYITIPVMSVTFFVALIVLYILQRKKQS